MRRGSYWGASRLVEAAALRAQPDSARALLVHPVAGPLLRKAIGQMEEGVAPQLAQHQPEAQAVAKRLAALRGD